MIHLEKITGNNDFIGTNCMMLIPKKKTNNYNIPIIVRSVFMQIIIVDDAYQLSFIR